MATITKKQKTLAIASAAATIYAGTVHNSEDLSNSYTEVVIKRATEIVDAPAKVA